MVILGFNSTHDASAALLVEGKARFAVEEERLSRRKHHYGFPDEAIRRVLEWSDLAASDVDRVAFYWNPYRGILPFALHFLRGLPRSLAFVRSQPGIWRDFVRMPAFVRRHYGLRSRFHFVDHHLAHAYSAFCPSPFERAAILSADGTGEWTTTSLAVGDSSGVRAIEGSPYPHSIGKVWEAVTQYLGFRPLSGEGKVMGLAPYGGDRFVRDFESVFGYDEATGRLRVDRRLFLYAFGSPRKFSPEFERRFGPMRRPDEPMEEHHRDVAFALQRRTEDVLLAIARRLHSLAGPVDGLALVGGVALNCVANGRLLREGPFVSGSSLRPAMRVLRSARRTGSITWPPGTCLAMGCRMRTSDRNSETRNVNGYCVPSVSRTIVQGTSRPRPLMTLPRETSSAGFRGAWSMARGLSGTVRSSPTPGTRRCGITSTSESSTGSRSGHSLPPCSPSGPAIGSRARPIPPS